MKRFPDIIVVSWQCDCEEYMTHSIDISNVNVDQVCEKCRMSYTLAIGEIDVEAEVIARARREISVVPIVEEEVERERMRTAEANAEIAHMKGLM